MAEAKVGATPALNPQGEVLASMARQNLDRGSRVWLVLKEIYLGREIHPGTIGEYKDAQNLHITTEEGADLPIPWSKIHHVESRAD
ncbi:hypothetical protein K2P56_01140 [Patescibacteria group bacterium]|nr:hypothetical protein [Patescibacteria group bacterium]